MFDPEDLLGGGGPGGFGETEALTGPPGGVPSLPSSLSPSGPESFWGKLQDFSTSPGGRGLAQAIAVGLLGLQPGRPLQGPAFHAIMQQAAEREKQRTLTSQAVATSKTMAGLLTASRAGDHGALLEKVQTAVNDPQVAQQMGPQGLAFLMQAGMKSAESLGKSESVQRALRSLGGPEAITTPEKFTEAFTSLTGPGGMSPDQALAFLKVGTTFGRMENLTPMKGPQGEVLGFVSPRGKTYSLSPTGGIPTPGPLALPRPPVERLTVENLSQETRNVLASAGHNPAEVVNRVNQGDEQGQYIYQRAEQMAKAIRDSNKEKKSYDEADRLAFTISKGKYKTEEEAIRAGDQVVVGAVQTQLLTNKTMVMAAGEREKHKIAMNETPVGMLEGYRGKTVVDRRTLKEDSSVPFVRTEGPARTHTILSEQDTKLWSGMNVMERTLPLLEEIADRLATTPSGVLRQKFEQVVLQPFGVATIGGVVKTLEAFKLRAAASFQGAAAQLSDKDVAAAEGLSLAPGDSRDVARMKIAGLRSLSRIIKASLADSETAAAEAIKDYRSSIDSLIGIKSGVPGMKVPPR